MLMYLFFTYLESMCVCLYVSKGGCPKERIELRMEQLENSSRSPSGVADPGTWTILWCFSRFTSRKLNQKMKRVLITGSDRGPSCPKHQLKPLVLQGPPVFKVCKTSTYRLSYLKLLMMLWESALLYLLNKSMFILTQHPEICVLALPRTVSIL